MITYKKGDIIKGKVTGIEDYGIFLNINNKYTGLIHISEISTKFVKDIKEFVKENQIIYSKVLSINEEKKRITLSIKNLSYNIDPKYNISEKGLNFKPLEDKLDIWINKKIEEIEKK